MGFFDQARNIENTIRRAEKVLNVLAGLMLLGMMFIGAADVIGRYVLNSPITGAMETNQLLMGGMVFLAWAYTQSKKAHVTVDIIFTSYPPRVQAICTMIMMCIACVLFSIMTWQSIGMVISDWQTGRLVKIILIPIAPFKALVPLGALFLAVECLIQALHAIPIIVRGKGD